MITEYDPPQPVEPVTYPPEALDGALANLQWRFEAGQLTYWELQKQAALFRRAGGMLPAERAAAVAAAQSQPFISGPVRLSDEQLKGVLIAATPAPAPPPAGPQLPELPTDSTPTSEQLNAAFGAFFNRLNHHKKT